MLCFRSCHERRTVKLIIYFLSYFVVFIFSFLYQVTRSNLFYYVVVLSMLSLAAFRAEPVGIDTKNYYYLFHLLGSSGSSSDFSLEFVFVFVVKAINGIGYHPEALIFVLSILSLGPAFAWIKSRSYDFFLSVILLMASGFYFSTFNISRQMVAVFSLCLAFSMLYKKKNFLAGCFIFLAVGFHYTAAFVALLYLLLVLKLNALVLFMLWGVSLFFLYDSSLAYIFVSTIIDGLLSGAYSQYLNPNEGENAASFRIYLLQVAFLFLVVLLHVKRWAGYDAFSVRCFLFSVILGNLTFGLGYFYRFVVYFEVYMVLAIPLALISVFRYSSYRAISVLIALISFLLYFRNLLNNSSGVVPYSFVF